jgi:hypothetical protein
MMKQENMNYMNTFNKKKKKHYKITKYIYMYYSLKGYRTQKSNTM